MAEVTGIKGYLHNATGNHPYDSTGNNQIGAYNTSYCERVYAFKVRPEGAKQVTITLTYERWGTGPYIHCLINESNEMYTADTAGLSVDGVQMNFSDRTHNKATVTLQHDMIGGVTYYAHIFAKVGTSNAQYMTVMRDLTDTYVKITEGDEVYGGLLRVWDDNGAEHQCIPYVYDGTQWKQCLAFVGDDSHAWHMGV